MDGWFVILHAPGSSREGEGDRQIDGDLRREGEGVGIDGVRGVMDGVG